MQKPTRRDFLKQSALITGSFVIGGAVSAQGCATGVTASETKDGNVFNTDEPGAVTGVRPYEMDWANRFMPEQPELVNFEDLSGWKVTCYDGAEVSVYRSKQEELFGEYTAKLAYKGTSSASSFLLEPPQPIMIPTPYTAANLWVRGNNCRHINPPTATRVIVNLILVGAQGQRYRLYMGVNDFDYWFLFHAPMTTPDGKTKLYAAIGDVTTEEEGLPVALAGIEVTGCANTAFESIYLDALSFYEMQFGALTFDFEPPAPTWPTTPDTLLPTFKENNGPSPTFAYTPSTGMLSDLTVSIDGKTFQPCYMGGVRFEVNGSIYALNDNLAKKQFLGQEQEGNAQRYNWQVAIGGTVIPYSYVLEVKGKSCVIDIFAEGGFATQLDIGLEKGIANAKTVFMPYLTYSWERFPLIVYGQGDTKPFFLLSLLDYYNSDASELFGPPDLTAADTIGYIGGARYKPTTNGQRNNLRERLFINVSTDVQEVLPNIPNPPCDTADIARECLINNLGDDSYPFPYATMRKYKAYGIDKYIANHHEKLWREDEESFTLRDTPAPSIGVEPLQKYCAFVKSLGYRIGLYSNYSDFAPVNAYWSEDAVCLNPDNTWRHAWERNYSMKPLRSMEYEARIAKIVHERYGTNASCIDVHTALMPWERVDYDARTPGAAKFRTQFDAYCHLLINESIAHGGPAISEGNFHWFYAGICDGSYATITPYFSGYQTPPLVDFDLLKMHTKSTDLGVGSPYTFYGDTPAWQRDAGRTSQGCNRFITATIAYGHIGFLDGSWGFDGMLKMYYIMQALQQRYVMIPVQSIQYFNGSALVDTSAAIATDAYKRRQLHIVYENGLMLWCNLNNTQSWNIEVDGKSITLPGNSFAAFKKDDILAYSAIVNGQHHTLVSCRDYLYLDTQDQAVSTSVISAKGMVAVKPDGPNAWRIIPATYAENIVISCEWLGMKYDTSTFTARICDLHGEPQRDTVVSVSEGCLHIGEPLSEGEFLHLALHTGMSALTTPLFSTEA